MTTKYLTTEELEVSRELLDIEHGHHTPKAPQLLAVLRQRFFSRINEVKADLQWLIERM